VVTRVHRRSFARGGLSNGRQWPKRLMLVFQRKSKEEEKRERLKGEGAMRGRPVARYEKNI
jgi:hypothetical protein